MPLPKNLLDGYRRYRATHIGDRGRLEQLAALGQAPTAMVVTCCDARLLPQEIFDAEPGALFIVRNVANLVPPYEVSGGFHGTSAAVEFAVLNLRVPHVLVLGHSHCGGIAAYRTSGASGHTGDHISRWMSLLDGACAPPGASEAEAQQALEFAAIRRSLTNLRSFMPLAERERDGLVALHGAHYDIANGALLALDETADAFVPVE